jgi:hypothetical protein
MLLVGSKEKLKTPDETLSSSTRGLLALRVLSLREEMVQLG